jgi:hypothetical protein
MLLLIHLYKKGKLYEKATTVDSTYSIVIRLI